jgi:uncharacterized protein GlcG (DUF336 family)
MRRRFWAGFAAAAALALWPSIGAVTLSSSAGGIADILTSDDVMAVITTAATALNDNTLAVAVVDRAGTILGVYARPGASTDIQNQAVSLARTTGYFSNDQAPLSSRTVKFISGIHFPPGVQNTGNAALYGVENINRGCDLDVLKDAIFNTPIDRPRSIAGNVSGPSVSPLPCNPSNTTGCSKGITTGKVDLFDTGNGTEAAVNPGGIPLYRSKKLIGGVGVAGVTTDRAQYAALLAAAGSGRGITTAIDFPNPIPTPGAIFIDGIRLPFYGSCGTNIPCIQTAATQRPSGSSPGSFLQGVMVVTARNGRQAPEGYNIGPRGSTIAGNLTEAEVRQIVSNAVATANNTRAAVRLPFGQMASFQIAISDSGGNILALYRMTDALFDATDVVPSKARNAYYFSTREGYDVLKSYVTSAPYDQYTWTPDPPAGKGWALTSRTISFGGQPLFPPGIDLVKKPTPGPWFDLFQYDTANPCTEGSGPSRGGNRNFVNQNGITWFPGSAPLYRPDGTLIGGIGVSGDGVEQNDLVSAAGAAGYEPPPALRVDQSVIRTGDGTEVRLPYLKYPRNSDQF